MEKFRVLSDLHIDINDKYPLALRGGKNIFTVICGDTSGYPDKTIEWIKTHCPNGVGVSGNHLPYNDYDKTVQELREDLSEAFPLDSAFTYLDCETDVFSKVVDGILFVGTCMYSDMHITHPSWNPTGNKEINMRASMSHMNDYRWGIKSKNYFLGKDNDPTIVKLSASDYFEWFKNAFNKIDKLLDENEAKESPLPAVLITHYNLITDFLEHNLYLEEAYSPRTYNWPSYASDYAYWLKRHTSIKCYCCGHIHAVEKDKRHFYIVRDDGSKILVVNNARGYVSSCHDTHFNQNRFVNVDTWTLEEIPFSKSEEKKRKKCADDAMKRLAWFF